MAALVPCPSCNRHVLSTESACPFCSSALAGAAPRGSAGRALTRAAILFAGANVFSACSSSQPVPMYGPAPIQDAAADGSDADIVVMYGPAVIDASLDANDADATEATDATPPDAGDD